MREQQGHKELYRMGFDGAAIEKLRHLSEKQYEELLVILEQLHSNQHLTKVLGFFSNYRLIQENHEAK